MNNQLDTRISERTSSSLTARTLIMAGFAVNLALCLSFFAFYTRTATMQELDKPMPVLNGDAATEYLKNDSSFGSLTKAMSAVVGDDLTNNPEAVVKITANDARPNDYFGSSVAISGNTVIVGAPQLREGNGGTLRGAAYIFVRDGASWAFQQKLTGDAPASDPDAFGFSVAISGDTAVVAAPDYDLPEDYNGVAYVYARTGSTWSLQKKLSPTDTPLVEGEIFSGSVAISGDTVLVGASGLFETSEDTEGMVHVFVRDGTTWTLQATLISGLSGSNITAQFGRSVGISGDMAVVGEPAAVQQEAAYIFARCGDIWTRQQRLTPSDGGTPKSFGGSVAISGNTVIIGAEGDRPTPNNQQGAAYIFVSDGTTWTQQQKLTATDAGTSSRFGFSVAIMGDTAIVGKHRHATVPFNQGFAFVFQRSGTAWTLQETLTASDGVTGDQFGSSVAISESVVLVGANDDDFGTAQTREGSAYLIDRTTQAPPPSSPECEDDIVVNITTDQPDADLEDDICDVDLTQSGNQCSLRAAIQTANAKDGPDEILFNIPGGGTQSISPLTQLPSLTETVTIDATTQPGYTTSPLIELVGTSTTGGLGFAAGSANSTVKGMAINRFLVAIGLLSSGNRIESCYIGLSPNGTPAGMPGAQQVGIDIRTAGASNNTIGGAGVLRNLIANNAFGIAISEGASGNRVIGNRIGTNAAGTSSIPNAVGVFIEGASNNRIGDDTGEVGNLISGNTTAGIVMRTNASNNIVADNNIGTNADGTEAIANNIGIGIAASSGNRIGVDTGANGNLISGNTAVAVYIETDSSNNIVASNRIGTNADGTAAVPNAAGVVVIDSDNNRIGSDGTPDATNGNLLSGNSSVGVYLQTNAADNLIGGNKIGTKLNGIEVLPNGQHGIFVDTGSTETTIKQNVIGGHNVTNESGGIVFGPTAGVENVVIANSIGVTANSGTTPLPNKYGIANFSDRQIIGSPTDPNYVSFNEKAGIWISSIPNGPNPVVEDNLVHYNRVGTNGSADTGNGEIGIWVSGNSSENTIAKNIVSGNTLVGIFVSDGASENIIKENNVGTNTGGTSAIPNDAFGIWIRGATDNDIDSNLVSSNPFGIVIGTNFGIESPVASLDNHASNSFGPTYTTGNRLFGNTVGMNAGRSAAIPGGSIGIAIGENARNNFIGTPTGSYNFIAGNTATIGYGIFLGTLSANPTEDSLPQFNTFQRNLVGLGGDLQSTISNNVGFVLLQAARNTVGGDTDALANIIVASTLEGISIRDNTRENTFLRNFLGVLPPGFGSRPGQTSPLSPSGGTYGNGSHGILLENGAQGNTLGGSTSSTGLVIANNGGNGINLAPTAGNGNRIGTNSIYGNTLPGIDLGGNGFTVNDPTDADVGPNNLQNYPTMTFSISGGNLIVDYQVDSAPANSVYGTSGIRVEFYEADSAGQGSTSLGTDQYLASDYTNGTPGTRQKNLGNAAALGFVASDRLTATATDAEGNSSEFTPAVSGPGGAGFEGDVAPRPNGDGGMGSTDVTQLRRFVSGLDTPNAATNEFQRIDCAPRSTFGDGVINSTDVVQGRRYVAGLDPQTPAGGPASRGLVPESVFVPDRDASLDPFKREISIGEPELYRSTVIVPIEMTSVGNEVAMSFTLDYDPSILADPRITLGKFAPADSTLTVNIKEPGRIGILIDSANAMTASAMPRGFAMVSFDVKTNASAEASIYLYLTDSLAARGISDRMGNSLSTRYIGGTVRIDPKND